jgi:hypothetical protein
LHEKVKEIGGPNPVQQTNIFVTEMAEALGITSFNIALPMVCANLTKDGKGNGEWSKLSAQILNYVRTSVVQKQVHKFDVEGVRQI